MHTRHTCNHALAGTCPWLSQCVRPCTGAGVEVEEQEEDNEDEAMAEADQVAQFREAGEEY